MKVLLLLVVVLPYISCQMVGGPVIQHPPLDDPFVLFAVKGISDMKISSCDSTLTPVKILYATSQVVSGVMWRYKIEISGCGQSEICDVAVWSRPWLTGPDKQRIDGTPVCAPKPGIVV